MVFLLGMSAAPSTLSLYHGVGFGCFESAWYNGLLWMLKGDNPSMIRASLAAQAGVFLDAPLACVRNNVRAGAREGFGSWWGAPFQVAMAMYQEGGVARFYRFDNCIFLI
jgi:hypothetical protein